MGWDYYITVGKPDKGKHSTKGKSSTKNSGKSISNKSQKSNTKSLCGKKLGSK